MNKTMIASFGLFLFTAAPAFANDLQVKESNGIPYISGGVGVDERQQLRGITTDDNLQLSFAIPRGNYLGGADVVIKDAQGKTVLQSASDGPLFFAKLQPGKYTIDATTNGKTIEQVVQVPAKGQKQVHFVWSNAPQYASAK